MRLVRVTFLAAAVLAAVPALSLVVPSDAHASVSIAVGFEALVKDADAVGVVTPVEAKSVWEDGRIYTYTKVKVDQSVAGDVGTGSEGWVRTMGGVVGKIGQMVDGEPVLTVGKPSLLFLRSFKQGGTWQVSARAQGQFPVLIDDTTKIRKVIRSANVGVLYPPKIRPAAEPNGSSQTLDPRAVSEEWKPRLAGEVLHDRPLDDVTREIATTWKKLHPPVSK
ncbi:MAG: hypothetical protein JST00_46680 [Deltaproteobacteria bacterium]|nr:hypothetical protein [Deltaproteobacteria bacterium]